MARNKPVSRLLIVAGLLLLGSCRSSTWVGGQACYPSGAERESADFCMFVNIEGGAGKAYVDRSRKRIYLHISNRRNQVVLEREYSAEAGDLRWLATWPERSSLQVVFFEYRDSAPMKNESKGLTKAPRQIFSLAFAFDESKGLFVEAAAPAAVLQEGAARDARENKRHSIELYYTDSPQTEARALQACERVAAKHDLQRKAPQPGLIGLLATWLGGDLSMALQRYDSSREIGVGLEDYGSGEVSQEIAAELRLLPALVRTRRVVSINFRVGPEGLDSAIRVVESIANKYGLHPMDPRLMFNVARFGVSDLQVSVDFFESDGAVKVLVEDLGWHTQFADIEQALRSAFSADGRHG